MPEEMARGWGGAAERCREQRGDDQDSRRSRDQFDSHQRPSFRARSISADKRVSSSSESEPESTRAAAACAAEPSKNVLTIRVNAELRALSRGTEGK
jgi:hypothetical protein